MPDRPAWVVFGEILVLLLMGAVALAVVRRHRTIFRRASLTPALLVGGALLVRFLAHPGPGDIRTVLTWDQPARAGWAVVINLMRDGNLLSDETLWTINRLVGALSVALMYVVVSARFRDATIASAAAAALAFTPLIVRFSASDTPYILLGGAWLGALVAFDVFLASRSVAALALGLGLQSFAIQLRPEASWLLVPTFLVVLSHGLTRSHLRLFLRPTVVLCGVSFIALNAWPTYHALYGPSSGVSVADFTFAGSVYGSPWWDPNTTPRPLTLLLLLGAMGALVQFPSRGTLWVAATLIALPINAPALGGPGVHGYSVHPTDQVFSQYSNARYHLPSMYLACGLVGLGANLVVAAARRWRRKPIPAAAFLAVGLVSLAALPGVDLLWRMWTPQREYHLFQAGLQRIDPRCRVVSLIDTPDAGWIPFGSLVPLGIIDVAQFMQRPVEGCYVYYRCANCYARDIFPSNERSEIDIHPECRAFEERFELQPIFDEEIPAVPFRGEEYARESLRVGFYDIRPRGEGTRRGNSPRG